MRPFVRSMCFAAVAAAIVSPVTAQSRLRDTPSAGVTGFASALVLAGDELYAARPGDLTYFPSPANHTGMIHVFARDAAGAWVQRDTVKAASSEVGDGFGSALAVSGNVLVVGAPKQNDGRGAAYVFERTGSGAPWRETATLTLADAAANERIGFAVAADGDVVLVGAPGRASGAGQVLVFNRSGARWVHAGTLAGSAGAAGDGFGFALALEGDRLLVGAPGPLPFLSLFGGQQPRAGSAYVYARSGDDWREEAHIAPAAADGAISLGAAVLLAGDEALVAAPLASQAAGTVVRYRRSEPGAWSEASRITPAQPTPGSGFGLSMDIGGDDLFVGAPVRNGMGAAYVFRRGRDGEFASVQEIASETQFQFFGSAVAAGTDIAVIGGPGADFFEGTGFVYRKDSEGQWQAAGTVLGSAVTLEPITGGMRECRDGKADDFDCTEVDLVSFLPVSALGGTRGMIVNDLWGWTDVQSGREYAIVGRADGTVFIDVTDAANPVYLGELPMHEGATANLWRDMKVYQDHVYIVADGAGPHGVQVFDLTRLRDVQNPPARFTEDAHYDRIHSAHNIVMNENTGFAYVVGASMGGETCGGGLHMIDVRQPKQPTFAGCFADPQTGNARTGYSHDAQCISYNGPDDSYRGREICFGSNETMLSIADVTDKDNPKAIARAAYPNVAYLHQGWVSEDHRYLFMNDEGDELSGVVPRTRTLIWDITDLDDPVLLHEYLGETRASDHNLYVRGNYVYESNYVSGLRIIDISDPANPKEAGHFDTVPWGENNPGFAGSWSNYPFFRSGNIIVSSMREGVFVLRFRRMERPIS